MVIYPNTQKCAGMETTGSGDSWGDKMNKSMLSNTLNKSKKEGKEGGRRGGTESLAVKSAFKPSEEGKINRYQAQILYKLTAKENQFSKKKYSKHETATTALQNL